MDRNYYITIFSLSTTVIISIINYFQIKQYADDGDLKDKILFDFGLLLFTPIASSILIYFIYENNILENHIWIFVLISILFISQLSVLADWNLDLPKKIADSLAATGITSTVIILIFGVGIYIRHGINPPIEPPNKNNISIDEINKNFNNIRIKYVEMDSLISNETKEIDTILESISKNILEKNKELASMEIEQKKIKKELEYYKALKSLSKEQTDAITKSLNSSKYLDYLIGGIIGFLSSLAVAFIADENFRKKFILRKKT